MYKKIQVFLALIMISSMILVGCAAPAPTQAPAAPPTAQPPTAVPPTAVPPTSVPVQPAEPTATTQASQPTVAAAPTEEISSSATGVVYQKKDSINGGNPIKLTLWDWFQPRADYYTKVIPEYKKLYPNVDIEITVLPWDEYWTKITTSLPAGQGPDILEFHDFYFYDLMSSGLLAPFPKDLFDTTYMAKQWIGLKEGLYNDAQGNLVTLPNGASVPLLYINKKMWAAAGLTEKDYPKTWDQVKTVAQKLTKTDANGKIQVAGFSAFGGSDTYVLWFDMIYQQGRYLLTSDKKGCQLDSPEARNALHEIMSFLDAKVVNKDFLALYDGFGAEKIAMINGWTWFTGSLKTQYPNVEYLVIPQPTFTGESLPSTGEYNYEGTLAVNNKIADDRKAVAFDFLHWLFSDPQKLIDMNFVAGVAPAYKPTYNDARIKDFPEAVLTGETLPYKIFHFDPAAFYSPIVQAFDTALLAGKSEDEIISGAQQACNQAFSSNNFYLPERTYQYNDKMIPNQP